MATIADNRKLQELKKSNVLSLCLASVEPLPSIVKKNNTHFTLQTQR